jgi:hypothetical protein
MDNKEALRQKRKEAYKRAKATRDADPRYQALKEKVNAERRAKYRAFKEQQEQAKRQAREKKIAEKDAALMALVMKGADLEQ